MRKENWTQEQYAALLREELRPALGCTEPVSIALCAAAMTKALGCMPERILVQCSRNILKNAKGVVVPNSGGMKGIDVAAALGAIVGAPERGLEVLTGVTPEQIEAARAWLARGACQVRLMDTPETLHLVVTGISGDGHTASAELKRTHTGLTRVTRDNVAIFHCKTDAEAQEENNAAKSLNVGGILTFAEKARLEENGLRELLERQIECNSRIAEEGLSHPYGACVGATLLRHFGESASVRAQAYAAAGSDARMGGCEMPVVINSGSGNQGLTVTLPVLEYARELGKDHETVLRAAGEQPCGDSHQGGVWAAFRVLRGRFRGRGQRRGDYLAARRYGDADRNDDRQHAGGYLRHGVRRRESLMRVEDRLGCRNGHSGQLHEHGLEGIRRRRRARQAERGADDRHNRPHGQRRHGGDG